MKPVQCNRLEDSGELPLGVFTLEIVFRRTLLRLGADRFVH